jgi:hypothetical protein
MWKVQWSSYSIGITPKLQAILWKTISNSPGISKGKVTREEISRLESLGLLTKVTSSEWAAPT